MVGIEAPCFVKQGQTELRITCEDHRQRKTLECNDVIRIQFDRQSSLGNRVAVFMLSRYSDAIEPLQRSFEAEFFEERARHDTPMTPAQQFGRT